jgi:DNA polymerase I-like protein with 3'-5' exonuclease and polymerase domains
MDLKIIKTAAELPALKEYLASKDFIAFDTETDGVERESRIIGMSFCADVELAYYVILRAWDPSAGTETCTKCEGKGLVMVPALLETVPPEPEHAESCLYCGGNGEVVCGKMITLETEVHAKDLLEVLIGKNLIMQNAPFDCAMVENNYKVKLMPYVHTDTLVLGHLLDENRSNGLKERGVELYGEDAATEQKAMQESVHKNGGVLTKDKYELFKADADLIALYGAKDAILTLKLFYHDVELLYEQGLDKFFYEDETMPLLRGPTYDMNTSGLRVDPEKLQTLKATLEAECIEDTAYILNEIYPHVKEKYPGDKKSNKFNINAPQQMAWLLFFKLENEFTVLTDAGKELCEKMQWRTPYTPADKRRFVINCVQSKGQVYAPAGFNIKTKKPTKPKTVKDPWQYIACGGPTLSTLKNKYKWVQRFLEYKKKTKLLGTYVEGIQERMRYNVIRPNFLQHGTTSGRYSCKNPNFQNLPRDDKRVKACIVSRPGKVFVGADHSQLEPRVFASQSGDVRLQACFSNGDDFYSVIGVEVYGKTGCSLKKDDSNSFAKLFAMLRHFAKQFGLAATYGATAHRLAKITGLSVAECQEALITYFERFPSVRKFMLDSHAEAKKNGYVLNLYGRPRRMPLAKSIPKHLQRVAHEDLPYEYKNILNLAVNHRVQSTAASIMNRGAIKVYSLIRQLEKVDAIWSEVKIVLQVHDELVLEGPEELAEEMKIVLKEGMETAATLPNVDLVAQPVVATNLADLK